MATAGGSPPGPPQRVAHQAVAEAIDRAFRDERAGVLATLIRRTGDFQVAEDALQDAFARAVVAWRRDGIPVNPGAWLAVTARRRAIDRLRLDRSQHRRAERLAELAELDNGEPAIGHDSVIEDDRLRLLFTCCHPALDPQSRVALTLRAHGVLSVVYLIFNEGYSATSGGRLVRSELCSEAVRLGWLLAKLMPNESETWGLLALMLLHDARCRARA